MDAAGVQDGEAEDLRRSNRSRERHQLIGHRLRFANVLHTRFGARSTYNAKRDSPLLMLPSSSSTTLSGGQWLRIQGYSSDNVGCNASDDKSPER